MRRNLTRFACDFLFIFDYYHASAMILDQQNWRRRCEVLAATGAWNRARADDHLSFTSFLCSELGDQRHRNGIAARDLYSKLTGTEKLKKHCLRKVPCPRTYSDSKAYPYGIFVRPKLEKICTSSTASCNTDKVSSPLGCLKSLKSITNAIMLIAANLTHDAATEPPNEAHWHEWIKMSPEGVSSLEFLKMPEHDVTICGRETNTCYMIGRLRNKLWDMSSA